MHEWFVRDLNNDKAWSRKWIPNKRSRVTSIAAPSWVTEFPAWACLRLNGLMNPLLYGAETPDGVLVQRRREPAAFPAAGQARDFPLPGRRSVAPGDVRPQAQAGGTRRQAHARVIHQGSADRAIAGEEADLLRAAVQVQEVWESPAWRCASCFRNWAAWPTTFALCAR